MAKDTGTIQDAATDQIDAENTEAQEQALAVVGSTAMAAGFEGMGFENEILAGLQSQIEETLKQISVTEFTGARVLLNQNVTLLDAFPFVMTEESRQVKGETVEVNKVMFTVANADGEILNVMQNDNPGRRRFITLYAKIKAANAASGQNKQLSLTNVSFVEMGKEKFGNKPIILSFTPDTQQVWGDAK